MGKRLGLAQGIMAMDRVREALRLKESGHAQREIHRITGIARSSLQEYLRTAREHGLTSERAREMSDSALRELFGKKTPGRHRSEAEDPDFEAVHRELKARKGTTLELLWQEWVAATGGGYSYSTFCRRYERWAKEKTVTLRHEYQGGEKLMTDFAGEGLRYRLPDGTTKPVQIFVAVMAASNRLYCEATESQKTIPWVGAHTRALEYFGGVPDAIIIDNLKAGVTRADRYEPDVSRAFEEWAAHYGTTPMPTRARKPRDKGKVEKAVQDAERWIIAPLRHMVFSSIGEINSAIQQRLAQLNARVMQDYGVSRDELFTQLDKGNLKPLPSIPFEAAEWKRVRVNLDYHIEVERHWYSVPYNLAREEVAVKVSERLVEVFYDNVKVASHPKSHLPYRHTTLGNHLPPHHAAVKQGLSPEGFRAWGKSVGPHTEQLIEAFLAAPRYREQSYRSLLGVRRLADKYGINALERAAETANRHRIVSQRFIRKILEAQSPQEREKTHLLHGNIRGADYYH